MGVLKDNVTTHMWYNIASANGSKKAGEYRDERAGLMTTDAIEKATAMAKECMNSNYILCGPVLSLDFTQVTAQDLNKGVDAALIAGDYTTGVKLWKLLAEQGDASAQLNLGFMYRNGNGVLKDATEAVKWFRLSAEQGFQHAQNNLGIQYENGEGVLQDYAEAVKWYRLSAEQGNATAHYNLGHLYSDGEGVLQDNITSYMWFNIAFANGDDTADYFRDERAALMTASEITKATAMARECMKSNYKKCGY